MSYHYDKWGWYDGEAEGERTTNVAPSNLSTSTEVGALRSNWTGYEWVELHYFAPIIDTPPTPVPAAVTMRQARIALYGAGLLASVDTAIDALPEPTKTLARIEWEYSNELQRGNALVAALTPALGLTSAQVDALFIQAATL